MWRNKPRKQILMFVYQMSAPADAHVHTDISSYVHTYIELLHVSANCVAIIVDTKYKTEIRWKCKIHIIDITIQNISEPTQIWATGLISACYELLW
jgi:hypothetical protein